MNAIQSEKNMSIWPCLFFLLKLSLGPFFMIGCQIIQKIASHYQLLNKLDFFGYKVFKLFMSKTFFQSCPGWGPDPKFLSDQTFQSEINPDQTFQTQRVSDQTFQTEGILISPSSEHGPDSNSDHCRDINQTMIRLKCARSIYGQTQLRSQPFMIRLKRARKSLIRERFYLWTNLLFLLQNI